MTLRFERGALGLFLIALCWAVLFQTHKASASQDAEIPLIAATLRGDLYAVTVLLETGANPNRPDRFGNTALIYAARDGRTKIVRTLLSTGADPGWVDGESVTPLILAAYKGHRAIVELLLTHEFSRDHRDQWGRRALDYALRRGTSDPIARMLRDTND